MVLVALEARHAGKIWNVGLGRHSGREHEMLRPQRDFPAVLLDEDGPFLLRLVVARLLAGRRAPVVELHDLRIHLEPVADLVLGREHRPVRRERQIGHVVVPDRIVQTEGLVAIAPAVAGPRVLLDDDGRHAEHPKARAETDGALSAADDHYIGLPGKAERSRFLLALLLPRRPVLAGAVLGAERTLVADRLLVALELSGGGEERPDLSLFEPDEPIAARDVRLEGEPACRDAAFVGNPRRRVDGPGRGLHRGEL